MTVVGSEVDVAVCVETFLSSPEVDAFNIPEYTHFSLCRVRDGGGISVWINNSFTSDIHLQYQDSNENCAILVCSYAAPGFSKQYVIICYRPPGLSVDKSARFMEELECVINSYWSFSPIIVGDFNLPDIIWSPTAQVASAHGTNARDFINMCNDYSFRQHISFYTRFRKGDNPSLLDLLITTDDVHVENLHSSAPIGKSDHIVIWWNMGILCDDSKSKNCGSDSGTKRFINYGIVEALLGGVDWSCVLRSWDVNNLWNSFISVFEEIIAVASSEARNRTYKEKWMTPDVRKHLNMKTRAWKRYCTSGMDSDWLCYMDIRNTVKLKIREARCAYEYDLVKGDDNKKNLFSHIRSVRKDVCKPRIIRTTDGGTINDPEDIANIFVSTFGKVSGFAYDPPCNLSFEDYTFPDDCSVTYDWVFNKVNIAISMLKNVSYRDVWGADIVKRCSKFLVHPLTYIFQCSLINGSFPDDLKWASVTPVHKGGSIFNFENYRPISLISVFAKIYEYVVRDWILSEAAILEGCICQHGFTAKRSVATNLMEFSNYVHTALDNNLQVDTVYLDISKAFDTVPHYCLINSMKSLGFNPTLVRWIANYLHGRKHRVIINNTTSEWKHLARGVPQGSVLGPILFNIFISGIQNTVKYSSILMYADDIKVFRVVENISDAALLQNDLDNVSAWLGDNYMKVSASKSAVVTYNGRNRDNILYVYRCNSIVIDRKENIKDLGVVFDADFSFRTHVDSVVAKLNTLYFILKNYLCQWTIGLTALIIRTYVRPVFEYCSCVWNSCPSQYSTYRSKLDKIINKFTKLCRDISKKDCNERLRILGLPTLDHRRVRGDCINIYNIMHGNVPVLNRDDFFNMSVNCTRNNGLKIFKPRVNNSLSLHCFPYRAIDHWNNLSSVIVNATNISNFKILFDNCNLDV